MRILLLSAVAALALLPVAAGASPVVVTVTGFDGRPLEGAVVTLAMPGVAAPVPRGPYVMKQQNIAFAPHILIVPVGASVSFPNLDRVRHHVYSFSAPRKFDLKLYGREENRSISFDRAGAVALGCNIHDAMNGVVYVVATPYAAVTGADGRVRIDVDAAGRGTLSVWHPSIRASGNVLSQPAAVGGAGLTTAVRLRR
ncbi:plastocyanin/azurin family domain protein [Sphingomonas sp. Leaf412]|uniref:hypothetical protein n=1 Tax=Sphingomonas sp. Leaf412 TaxID=1736370 RepID=UPI0006FADD99|nr:hypothetical protein [Sphingomonas sp. Leaf412]KQT31408.1 plastocyanin/azurin family domain protein [Sphingomonas sp. Leaf412]